MIGDKRQLIQEAHDGQGGAVFIIPIPRPERRIVGKRREEVVICEGKEVAAQI